jgi:hypothetical protein
MLYITPLHFSVTVLCYVIAICTALLTAFIIYRGATVAVLKDAYKILEGEMTRLQNRLIEAQQAIDQEGEKIIEIKGALESQFIKQVELQGSIQQTDIAYNNIYDTLSKKFMPLVVEHDIAIQTLQTQYLQLKDVTDSYLAKQINRNT